MPTCHLPSSGSVLKAFAMGAYDAGPNPEARRALSSVETSRGCAGHGVGVVADIASANRVGSADPFVAKVFCPPNFIDTFGTHSTFLLDHNLFSTLCSRFAVQPRHCLEFAIEIALPLRERVVGHALFDIPCLALCITTPLHVPTRIEQG